MIQDPSTRGACDRSNCVFHRPHILSEHSNRAKIESGANHLSTVHAFVIATLRIGLHTPLVARRRKLCVCVCVWGGGGGGV